MKSVGEKVLAVGAIAGGASVYIGEKLARAAISAQEETGKLDQAIRNQGLSVAKLTPQIKSLEAADRALGFTNSDVRESLTKLISSGDSFAKATKDMAEAADLARYKNIGLADASQLLIQAHAGNLRAFKQLGIVVPTVSTAVDAVKAKYQALSPAQQKASKDAYEHELALARVTDKMSQAANASKILEQRIHGQADEFSKSAAGGIARFHASMGNLEESLGAHVLPFVSRLADGLSKLIDVISAATAGPAAFKDALEKMGLSAQTAGDVVKGLGDTVGVLKSVFSGIGDAVAFLADEVRAHWAEIRSTVVTAVTDIKAVVTTVVDVVTVLWRTFGDEILAATRTVWNYIKDTIKNTLEVIRGIIDVIAGLIHGDWSRVWKGIQEIVGGTLSQIANILRTAVSLLGTLAKAIGEAILKFILEPLAKLAGQLLGKLKDGVTSAINAVIGFAGGLAGEIGHAIMDGIIHGVGGLGSGLLDKLKGAVGGALHGVMHAFHIGSPSLTFAEQVGKPIAQGIELGYLLGSASLPSKITASLRQALETAKKQIDAGRASFKQAWSTMASDADEAFTKIRATAEKALPFTSSAGGLSAFSQREQQAKDLANAQQGVAQAGLDANSAAILDSYTAAWNRLQAAISSGKGVKQATTDFENLKTQMAKLEETLGSNQSSAVQQYEDLTTQIVQDKLNTRATAEKSHFDAQTTLLKKHLDEQLATLETNLEKQGASHRKGQTEILQLLDSYGVSYKNSGEALGNNFAQGIRNSIGAAVAAAQALASAVAAYMPHSPAEKGPLSVLPNWGNYLLPGLSNAVGGVNAVMAGLRGPGLAGAIGPRVGSPSLALAAGGGGGMVIQNLTVSMPHYVGDKQQFAYELRDQLLKLGRNEPNIFGGRA